MTEQFQVIKAIVSGVDYKTDWCIARLEVLNDFRLRVQFADGLTGMAIFDPEKMTGVFERLREPKLFQQADLDDGRVVWPGELDIAPDAMHRQIKEYGQFNFG